MHSAAGATRGTRIAPGLAMAESEANADLFDLAASQLAGGSTDSLAPTTLEGNIPSQATTEEEKTTRPREARQMELLLLRLRLSYCLAYIGRLKHCLITKKYAKDELAANGAHNVCVILIEAGIMRNGAAFLRHANVLFRHRDSFRESL